MRIPTSVIVMSVLTAAPFGLGIRDSLKAKPAVTYEGEIVDDDDRHSARRDHAALAEYEAEAAREAAEEKVKRAKKLESLDTLFGVEPASIGSWLGSPTVGSMVTEKMHIKVDELSNDGLFIPTMDDRADRLRSVTVQISSYDYEMDTEKVCGMLRDKLTAAWGRSVRGTWLNAATHQRATLTEDPCLFSIDQVVDADAWVASLPIDAMGQSGEKVAAKAADLGAEVSDYDTVEWSLPGVGYSSKDTDVVASLSDAGKVTFISVATDSDFDTVLAIRDALSAKLKAQPTRDEDTGGWVWKKKPGFSLVQEDRSDRFELQIGKDPSL